MKDAFKMDLEMDLELPEAEIDGLYFNKQEARAVFEKHDDGWWQSKDILFLSARNVEDDNSRDILTEYLNDYRITEQIAELFNVPPEAITVALPQKPKGAKNYHGVDWGYWLSDPYPDTVAYFCRYPSINIGASLACAVVGCAPAFRVNGIEEEKK
jgi:hypothetical protein